MGADAIELLPSGTAVTQGELVRGGHEFRPAHRAI